MLLLQPIKLDQVFPQAVIIAESPLRLLDLVLTMHFMPCSCPVQVLVAWIRHHPSKSLARPSAR